MTRPDVPSLVDDCRTALRRVEEGTRWAYSAGFYPSRRWVGEPPGREMHVAGSDDVDDDKVPGPTHDVGLADYSARQAVLRVPGALSQASAHLYGATAVVAAANRLREVPKATAVPGWAPLEVTLHSIGVVDFQLDVLEAADLDTLNNQAARHVAGLIRKALQTLDAVAAGLDRWAEGAKTGRDLPVAMCRTCQARPRPLDAKGRIDGAECKTCATWRARHNGQTRPPTEDMVRDENGKWVRPEVAAKARRDAQGVGHGWG